MLDIISAFTYGVSHGAVPLPVGRMPSSKCVCFAPIGQKRKCVVDGFGNVNGYGLEFSRGIGIEGRIFKNKEGREFLLFSVRFKVVFQFVGGGFTWLS